MSGVANEKTYTLAEAQRELRIQECLHRGHSFDIIQTIGDGPIRVTCEGCGWSGSVTMGEPPWRKRPAESDES